MSARSGQPAVRRGGALCDDGRGDHLQPLDAPDDGRGLFEHRDDVVIGKPHGGIVREAALHTGYALEEMAMVGDRLYTDVASGVNHGMTGILVLSGEATMDDVSVSDVKPDLIFGRLSDMIPYL